MGGKGLGIKGEERDSLGSWIELQMWWRVLGFTMKRLSDA